MANIKYAKDELNAYILGGIMPLVSHRNASFVKNEISGIDVEEDLVKAFEGLD